MSHPGPVVLLDANVLYSATVRDLLLTLAEAALLAPRWTDQIHNEWISNLLRKRPDLDPSALGRTRAAMEAAFPEALIRGYERHIPYISLHDPGDAHVVAAAIEARASVIATFNLKHFPRSQLQPHGVVAADPDAIIAELLRNEMERCCAAISARRRGFRKPPLTADEYVAMLARANLPRTSARLREAIDRI